MMTSDHYIDKLFTVPTVVTNTQRWDGHSTQHLVQVLRLVMLNTHTPRGYKKVSYLYNEAFWGESKITSQDGLNEDRLCFLVREWNWVRVVIHGPEITYFEHPISTKRDSTQAYFTSFTKCGGEMVGLESCQESNIKNEVSLYYSSKWSLWSLIIIQFLCERTLW